MLARRDWRNKIDYAHIRKPEPNARSWLWPSAWMKNDERIYADFADGLRQDYPATADVFEGMRERGVRPSAAVDRDVPHAGSAITFR